MRRYLRLISAVKALPTTVRSTTSAERANLRSHAANTILWGLFAVISLATIGSSALLASDHADPVALGEPESNITGLFFFPKGDRMIAVLNIRRSLSGPQPSSPNPFNLEPFEYTINMDLKTPVSFTDPARLERFGGTVDRPQEIHADVAIKIRLNNDVTLKDISFKGLAETGIEKYFGVRDDPFVFPRFSKTNVISMVFSIPKTSFPADQHDFILWATIFKDGEQIDHVGRSLRTQLPRLGFLNTLPPSEHVEALMKKREFTQGLFNFLRGAREWWSKAMADILQFTFMVRNYDIVPDVMIYSDRRPPGFPNGRQLEDDVVAKVCATDDCLLQDLSFIEDPTWPRTTSNQQPFLAEFPYLAEPQPSVPAAAATYTIWPYAIAAFAVVALLFWGLVEIIRRVVFWLWGRLRREPATATQ